jgi:GNAT superfamily N-acetyltransferase
MIEVREISRQDLDAITAGIASRTPEQHRRRLQEHELGTGFVEFVAWIDGVPAGWVGLGWKDDAAIDEMLEARGDALVYDLHVEEQHRRRGAGRALMGALEDRARSLGASAVILDTGTGQDFAAARALYDTLGYTRMGGVYLGGWSDPDRTGVNIVDQLMQWRKPL